MNRILRFITLLTLSVSITSGFTFANSPFLSNLNPERFPKDHNQKSTPHFDLKIGYLSDGVLTFIADPDNLKAQWAKAINNASDLKLSFDKIEISFENDQYFLRAYDNEIKASSIIGLVLDGKYLYEIKHNLHDGKESGGGYTVTCTGCKSTGPGSASECKVELNPGVGYYCSDCSEGDCIKTTTYIGGGGIFD